MTESPSQSASSHPEASLSSSTEPAGPPQAGGRFAELDALSTEELRVQAFALARRRMDLPFFWSVLRHLPDADEAQVLDGSPNSLGPTVDEAVALWREFTGHGYAESEPLLRAAFIDYLSEH